MQENVGMFGFGKRKQKQNLQEEPPALSIAQMEAHKPANRRNASGDRVLARFDVLLPNEDIFNQHSITEAGCAVVNVKGGCFYFKSDIDEDRLTKTFPERKPVIIKKLVLQSTESFRRIELTDLAVMFHQFRPTNQASGLVLKFINVTTEQHDLLNSLQQDFLLMDKRESWEQIQAYMA